MALFSATMGTLASLATLAAGAAVVGGTATSIVTATQSGKGSGDISMPEVPKVEDATKTASLKTAAKRTAMARSKTTYTSPLGELEEANVARKTLLGQ